MEDGYPAISLHESNACRERSAIWFLIPEMPLGIQPEIISNSDVTNENRNV